MEVYLITIMFRDERWNKFKSEKNVFGKEIAINIAKEIAHCENVIAIDVIDSSIGEVVYGIDTYGVEYIAKD